MAINLDKATELFNASMARPLPQNTCPMVIERNVDITPLHLLESGTAGPPKGSPRIHNQRGVNTNPSLTHTNHIPLTNWKEWTDVNREKGEKIRLFIKTVMGRCIAVELRPDDTLKTLKQIVHESEEGLPHHLMRFRTYRGIELVKDEMTIKECGFDFDSEFGDPNRVTLQLMPRESTLWR